MSGPFKPGTMIRALLFATLLLPASAYQYGATPAQRKAAFQDVGAPAADVSLPFLPDVTSLQPNTTFIIPNATTSAESAGPFDYRQALTLPWQYMKAERLGRLPADNGIPWRADAFLQDRVPNGLADAVIAPSSS